MSTSDAPALAPEFDARRAYGLHPDLALRPERFGALLYHYGNRRLTFLKSPQLAALVADLGNHESVTDALDAHEVSPAHRPAVLLALARLQASEVIRVR